MVPFLRSNGEEFEKFIYPVNSDSWFLASCTTDRDISKSPIACRAYNLKSNLISLR